MRNLAFNLDGTLLAVGMGEKERLWSLNEANGDARVWSTLSHQAVSDTLPQDGPVNQLAFHPKLPQLVAGCGSSLRISALYPGAAHAFTLRLPERGSWPLLARLAAYQAEILPSGGLSLRDKDGKNLRTVEHGDNIAIHAFDFSPDELRWPPARPTAPPASG